MSLSQEIVQAIYDLTYYLVFHLTKAVTALNQRDSYLYWPFIVSSIVIAVLAWAVSRTWAERSWKQFFRENFSARLWWHPSARADYRIYLANALVVPALFGYLLLTDSQLARILSSVLGPGALPSDIAAEPPGLVPRALFTLGFFIAYDFGRFAAHCLLHDVPVLWEFHKVHHSAEVLTPITSFRAHPVELLLMAWGPLVTTALVTWAFTLVYPGGVTFYSFLGLHVLLWAFSLIDNLRHSPVWISYGPTLGRWLISPAHHQLHHSREPEHLGRNRGFDLAIWDRLWGTLYVPAVRPETFRIGLSEPAPYRQHSIAAMYLAPFLAAGRQTIGLVRQVLGLRTIG